MYIVFRITKLSIFLFHLLLSSRNQAFNWVFLSDIYQNILVEEWTVIKYDASSQNNVDSLNQKHCYSNDFYTSFDSLVDLIGVNWEQVNLEVTRCEYNS